MSAFALHDTSDRDGVLRWGGSAALILALHAALIAAGTAWYRQALPPGVPLPVITIDLAPPAPEPSAPEVKPAEVPPPQVEPPPPQAIQEPAPPEPVQAQPVPQPAPSPEPMISPSPLPEPAPAKPEPATALPEPKPAPAKPKPAHTEAKKPAVATPRHNATASERPASAASTPQGAPNPEAMAAYNRRVAAHLQGFRPAPIAGQQGISRLSFTLGRSGQVLGSRLAGSSGHPALDSEALAMVRRAQPFPPIPPELKQASISFTVPIKFSN